jgi:hypothetical protein
LRSFTMTGSNHPNHTVLARQLQAYLRWRNANAGHPAVLDTQRRERARIRSEHSRVLILLTISTRPPMNTPRSGRGVRDSGDRPRSPLWLGPARVVRITGP